MKSHAIRVLTTLRNISPSTFNSFNPSYCSNSDLFLSEPATQKPFPKKTGQVSEKDETPEFYKIVKWMAQPSPLGEGSAERFYKMENSLKAEEKEEESGWKSGHSEDREESKKDKKPYTPKPTQQFIPLSDYKRKQTMRACQNCVKAKAGCDLNRPCRRLNKLTFLTFFNNFLFRFFLFLLCYRIFLLFLLNLNKYFVIFWIFKFIFNIFLYFFYIFKTIFLKIVFSCVRLSKTSCIDREKKGNPSKCIKHILKRKKINCHGNIVKGINSLSLSGKILNL